MILCITQSVDLCPQLCRHSALGNVNCAGTHREFLSDFRGTTIIDGAGHWVQQEAPDATNEALQAFVDSLD